MRVALPCVHEGESLVNWDTSAVHFQHRRNWLRCNHPDTPLGVNTVCSLMGCGMTCKGYTPDQSKAHLVEGIPPLSVQRLKLEPATAFNASLLRWYGQWLLAYRDRQGDSRIWIASLDNQFKVVYANRLDITHARALTGQEDPRLFIHNNRLHIAFVGVEPWTEHPHQIKANVLYARLANRAAVPRWGDYYVEDCWAPHYEPRSAWEKNWAFFSHDNRLYCVYSIKPHRVFEIAGDQIVNEYLTETPHAWTGGHLRGGASPVRVGDVLYHWFHGRVGEGTSTTYNTGVYTFEAQPPFRVLRMTRNPVQWADPETKGASQAAVVFACGAHLEKSFWMPDQNPPIWHISEGVHDSAVDVVTFDSRDVEERLALPRGMTRPAIPPVFVLYCEELPERKARISEHLNALGIAPIWWRSVHGKSWGLQTRKIYVEGESPINAGQVGLILGHYTLWQHLDAIGVDDAIILEDDAVLVPDFHERFADARSGMPSDTGLCYIGHLGCSDRIKERYSGGVVSLNYVPWATHCYYVHKRALPTLLANMAEARNPVDSQLWHNVLQPELIGWYAVEETLATQESAAGLVPTTLSGFNDWAIHPEPLRSKITESQRLPGWAVLEKARMLAGLVVREKPNVVVELGVFGGKSLAPLALALQHNRRGIVYGVDPWTIRACQEHYPEDDANAVWWTENANLDTVFTTFVQYVTEQNLWPYVRLLCAPSQDVAQVFDETPIDVLHIDGNHSREASMRDVRLYITRVRPGGWVWFDDTQWESTQDAQRLMECYCRCVIDAPAVGGGLKLYQRVSS